MFFRQLFFCLARQAANDRISYQGSLTHSRLQRKVDGKIIGKEDSNYSVVIGIAPSTPPNHLLLLSHYLAHHTIMPVLADEWGGMGVEQILTRAERRDLLYFCLFQEQKLSAKGCHKSQLLTTWLLYRCCSSWHTGLYRHWSTLGDETNCETLTYSPASNEND